MNVSSIPRFFVQVSFYFNLTTLGVLGNLNRGVAGMRSCAGSKGTGLRHRLTTKPDK